MDRSAPRLVPARALVALLPILVLTSCGQSTYRYDWNIFFDSIFRPDHTILSGLWLTVAIATASQVLGLGLGVLGGLGRMSRVNGLRRIASFYVWFFRGTPLLVQIMFLYFGLGVTDVYRWPDITLFGFTVSGAVQAGIVALGLNEGAYMSEIVRAGILSIDAGQLEAARSVGMTYRRAMRRIVLPQAARVIVPPLGNEYNNMLKTTSLLVVISVPELYVAFSNKNASGPTVFHPFELFLAAAVWYLLLTTVWGLVQRRIERRVGRGLGIEASPKLRERLFGLPASDLDPAISSGRR